MIRCPACQEENPPRFRLCGFCGAALPGGAPPPPALPARELRKTVTIVFADLVGSTALGESLDAEALHEVKERYFAAMAAEIARHGGKVEKYIGDAVMAIFGLPRAHEDDALRAARAALGMQQALTTVNARLRERFGVELTNRTGVNTGEVVTSDDGQADQRLASGDAVNLAARMEQAAPPGQIYLGEATWQLVRDAVQAEAVGGIMVKGKAQPQAAWRLLAVTGQDGVARRHASPLVGRDAELEILRSAWREATARREPRLVTVLAEAGAGKSRLAQAFVAEALADGARCLHGRCLPYGDGITFWPLSMMLREACGIDDDLPRDKALARLHAIVGQSDIAERLASVAGLSEASFALHEINWAARVALEQMATQQPVVALMDDVHWAEPAFLDLVRHVLAEARAPILLLAAGRPELLEAHPDWGGGERAARIVLRPLGAEAAAQAVRHLPGGAALPEALVARIVQAADGNPLYAEQLLSMLVDRGVVRQQDGGDWVAGDVEQLSPFELPPTIQALLTARLDNLGRTERAAVEPASVVGYEFEHAALDSLVPDAVRARLQAELSALERKQFIRTERAAGLESVYRFHHHLVRDAVYGGLLKRARAQLHLRFVQWCDRALAERALELDEILGYHLEQAHRCLKELGPLDDEGRAAGAQAVQRLSSAARRVFARGDLHAAIGLYTRALSLLGPDDTGRGPLLNALGETLLERGEFQRAKDLLQESVALAERTGNAMVGASAKLMRMRVALFSGEPGEWSEPALRFAHDSIALFEGQSEGEQSDLELARAWRLIGFVHGTAARYAQSSDAVARSMEHAQAIGDQRLMARNAMGLAISMLLGPTPVDEAIERCEAMEPERMNDRQAGAKLLCTMAQLRAMRGEFDAARALYLRGREMLRELAQGVVLASTGIDMLLVESLAGDLAAAEAAVRPDYEFLSSAGETFLLSTMAALLSRVTRDQGRDEDALALSRTAEQAADAEDVDSQVLWRSIRAPILARAGALEEAEALARSALELVMRTDSWPMQADALCELATVQQLAGRAEDARDSRLRAFALYRAKGDLVSSARLARQLS